jgi:hypothetical protein
MTRLLCAAIAMALVCGIGQRARGDAKEAAAIVDKAIKAVGGEEKLSKAKVVQWKGKGKIRFGENENEFTAESTTQDLDHTQRVFEGEFNGNPFRAVTVVAGKRGWRKFGDNPMELEDDGLANEKRALYLGTIPVTLVQLKGKEFKLDTVAEEEVHGKPASGVKVTAADGKDFTLYFDKESGLPVKQVATVMGFGGGGEVKQETTFSEYKDFGGIKKATKVESKRDGQPFQEMTITEFKVLDKVDPKTFAEPQ